ncbi:MarR family transcriptional regulator [Spartinivicinus poritis]|uniref:Helix-turn-helix domain-containing protein n=1 Tax=Spartinivicinus poritis TaxID=2994640 RepID=A0ABT5UAH4_9GAMM|nr:helix-turn-helix domain-containing protein [Spartinivicinus sp. A2-2]MDE1463386.1 helix-turn-helix domain-containing protein [Spartinivicinus sp. A2-2]
MHNAFDPHEQATNLNAKIIAGLERLSTVFRAVIQQQAKANKLTPLQTQLLLFIASHREHLCTVTRLAEEFVVTKATVSDSIRVLVEKGYLTKQAKADPRTFSLGITPKGSDTISATAINSAV